MDEEEQHFETEDPEEAKRLVKEIEEAAVEKLGEEMDEDEDQNDDGSEMRRTVTRKTVYKIDEVRSTKQ